MIAILMYLGWNFEMTALEKVKKHDLVFLKCHYFTLLLLKIF